MYVATKGGEAAIANAHALLAEDRRGNPTVPEIGIDQIREQLSLGVDRVMAEGSLYDPELAALALKQARGDQVEAIFLLRAYRTTLPRFGYSESLETSAMHVHRRISATFKDVPGGQILGPTFDYTHRVIDGVGAPAEQAPRSPEPVPHPLPRVSSVLGREGLLEGTAESDQPIADLTREPLRFPADRSARLQMLARGDEGFLLGMGYSTQRGYGRSHPFAGEIRMGEVAVEFVAPELGFAIDLGDIVVTECDMVNQFKGSKTEPPQFTRGYGLVFGFGERKAMAMALVDRAMRAEELGEEVTAPAPGYRVRHVPCRQCRGLGLRSASEAPASRRLQSELTLIRAMRQDAERHREAAE